MTAAVENAVSRAPSSRWAASALFLAGNFYWVRLDRDRAASYYKRLADQFPTSTDAVNAQWRVAWTLVLKRAPEAAQRCRSICGAFLVPSTPRMRSIGLAGWPRKRVLPVWRAATTTNSSSVFRKTTLRRLAVIARPRTRSGPQAISGRAGDDSAVPVLKILGETIPAAAAKRARARRWLCSRSLLTRPPNLNCERLTRPPASRALLLEAAQAAADAGHYGAAIVTVRQIYPQLEAHPLTEVPRPVWLAAYALPFQSSIRRWSANAGVDPMLVAGLIRQESAFEPEARSPANAFGLMQLLPPTARRLAKQANVRYSHARLVDPDYNVRLGTIYVAGLQKQFGNIESALAAYNAGEDRVQSWTAGQNYREPAEFVESIPFTETRQYVQIVTRNADIYRRLYGDENESRKARTRGGR